MSKVFIGTMNKDKRKIYYCLTTRKTMIFSHNIYGKPQWNANRKVFTDVDDAVEYLIQSKRVSNFTPSKRLLIELAGGRYVSLFSTIAEAVIFEDAALSIGDEFLPQWVIDARDSNKESVEYYNWLYDQAIKSYDDNE